MHVVYLHGFASSPRSSKARFFAERLRRHGVDFSCPDLNEPDFGTLTVSRMLRQVERLIGPAPDRPQVVIGSSLGGFVGWHAAHRWEQGLAGACRVDRLVLLAPAFEFGANRMGDPGEVGLDEWRRTGWREFFHHDYGEPRLMHFELYRDAQAYDSWNAGVRAPALVCQGRRDETVDAVMVERFAAAHPNITLRLFDDDHQLHESLETIWAETRRFLSLT
jgi:hypothetical protein